MSSHSDSLPPIELIKYIELVYLFCDVADEQLDIVLGDIKTAMPKQLREGNHIAAVDDPLLGEGVPIAVNAGSFNTTTFIIFVKHMVASSLYELLSKDITKQIILSRLMVPIAQILGQNARHSLIEGHD